MPNKYILMELTKIEEDYLIGLLHITVESGTDKAGTNQLAGHLGLSPASVNGMLKKLKAKGLVDYEKYGKLELTKKGRSMATELIRKHRLWETFLYEHMNFTWDEVHDVAEQLEHINSPKLIRELDRFLGYPKVDPHGDVIPGPEGKYEYSPKITLAELGKGERCRLKAVKDGSVAFLRYVSELGLELSSEIAVKEIRPFDKSLEINFDNKDVNVSRKFAENLFVSRI